MEPAVSYFTYPECPDLQFFRCEPMRANLSTAACASNYKASLKKSELERLHHCRNCPIGAMHAGETFVRTSSYYGSNICARCHRPSMRIIKGRLCVSCQNREYEYLKGRNAKGSRPVKLSRLDPRRVRCQIGRKIIDRRIEHSDSMEEVLLTVLRNAQGAVRFGYTASAQPLPQPRLF